MVITRKSEDHIMVVTKARYGSRGIDSVRPLSQLHNVVTHLRLRLSKQPGVEWCLSRGQNGCGCIRWGPKDTVPPLVIRFTCTSVKQDVMSARRNIRGLQGVTNPVYSNDQLTGQGIWQGKAAPEAGYHTCSRHLDQAG